MKEGASLLREHLGPPKRIRGREKYRIVRKAEEKAWRADDEEELEEVEVNPSSDVEEIHVPKRPKPTFD